MEQCNIQARIEQFIECDGLTTNKFARVAGIDPANMGRMLAGQQTITDKTLRKIADAHGVSFEWLKYGEGEMMAAQPTATVHTQTNQSGDNVAGDKIQLVGMDAKTLIEKEQKRICELQTENEHLKKLLDAQQQHIDTLKSQLADKDDIIALLKENRK